MVGEYSDPDMRTTTPGQLVVEGVESEFAFHAAEGIFDSGEGNIEFPQLLVFECDRAAKMIAPV